MTQRQSGGSDPEAVPDLVLERLRLGELPHGQAESLHRLLERDGRIRSRLEALERSDAELRRALSGARLADRVRARAAGQRERQRRERPGTARAWPLPAGLAVAATAVLALALRALVPATSLETRRASPAPAQSGGSPAASSSTRPPAPPEPGASPRSAPRAADPAPAPEPPTTSASTPPETGGDRIKGLRPSLALFRKTPSGSEALADGDGARQGDVVRVGYNASGRRYGVIVSLDGRGSVTRHLPEQGAVAAPLASGEVVLLAHAYQLDDAPAWERFFFVTADEPFDVAAVEDAARRAGADRAGTGVPAPLALQLPKPLEQTSFLLTKERRP